MNIRVLGSSGSEGPGHNAPAFLIDDFLLMDAGTVSVSLSRSAQCKITHILLSHAHLDHIKGIPFLVDNLLMGNEGCRFTVLSGKEVIADLKENIFNNKIWPDFTVLPNSSSPVMRFQTMTPRECVEVGAYRICMARVDHSVPAYGFMIKSSQDDMVIYTGDTGPTNEIWRRMQGHKVRAVIVEVSFPDDLVDLALASGHLTPSLLIGEIEKMPVTPDRIYITHLKPFFRSTIEEQLSRIKGQRVEIIEDGMIITT